MLVLDRDHHRKIQKNIPSVTLYHYIDINWIFNRFTYRIEFVGQIFGVSRGEAEEKQFALGMIFFALLAIALTLGYVFVKWRYTYWQRLGVPCPQPSFFVGNVGSTLTMTSHLALLCEQWYRWVDISHSVAESSHDGSNHVIDFHPQGLFQLCIFRLL